MFGFRIHHPSNMISLKANMARVALPRILDILKRTGIKATFFVPGWIAEKYREKIVEVVKAGHEIAHHGYMHEFNESMTEPDERAMFIRGKEVLKKITGQEPVGYRMSHSPNTLSLLSELRFLYDSSAMNEDVPYLERFKDNRRPIVELPFGFLCMDTPGLIYSFDRETRLEPLLTADMVGKQFRDEYDVIYREGKYCMFTLHPQVIGRPSRALMLEKTIRYIKTKPGVWVITARELAEYFIKRNST
jgi:peptidoglycan/xylan/chitin deacetylase (PgdA/CDA1 family)